MIKIYGKSNCPQCDKAKQICESLKLEYQYSQLDVDYTKEELLSVFPQARTMPQIEIEGAPIGGLKQFIEVIKERNIVKV